MDYYCIDTTYCFYINLVQYIFWTLDLRAVRNPCFLSRILRRNLVCSRVDVCWQGSPCRQAPHMGGEMLGRYLKSIKADRTRHHDNRYASNESICCSLFVEITVYTYPKPQVGLFAFETHSVTHTNFALTVATWSFSQCGWVCSTWAKGLNPCCAWSLQRAKAI
jgi:hypothetical protein